MGRTAVIIWHMPRGMPQPHTFVREFTQIHRHMDLLCRLQPQKSDEIHYTTEEPDSYWLRSLIEKYMPEF